MTNAMIITMKQVELQKEGILKYTGRMLNIVGVDGEEIKVPEIQPIHTFAKWKTLGYSVKKGSKAVAQFPIWKYTSKKSKDMSEDEAQEKGYCFMKTASFFTDEQVELINQ